MYKFHLLAFILPILLSACAPYTRDMLWENKIKSTPYEQTDLLLDTQYWHNDQINYSWLGHASVLINFYGTMIITDPVLLDRIGPPEVFNNMFGIKRIKQLPIDIEKFPNVDVALISHPHFDHLDLASLKLLNENSNATFIMPLLNKDLIDDGYDVIELDWLSRREKSRDFAGFSITAFQVEHYGHADWGERDVKRGFNGYLISSQSKNKHIAFFGDTSYYRYRDTQGDILDRPVRINWRDKFPASVLRSGIDLCIIPIGDSHYYWNHIGPQDAIKLSKQLHCKKMLPIHYATFILTPPDDEQVKPKQRLIEILQEDDDLDRVECQVRDGVMVFPEVGVSCLLP